MKKILLVIAMLAFALSMAFFLFAGSVGTAILMTLVLVVLIAFSSYLFVNNPRWWVVLLMLVLAVYILPKGYNAWNAYRIDQIFEQAQQGNDKVNTDNTQEDDAKDQETDDVSGDKPEAEKTIIVEKPVIVEKEVIKEVIVEVPVEKEVIKEVIVEVPVEKEPETNTGANNTVYPNYNYTGDPTVNPYYNGGYYGNGYYGDPYYGNGYYNTVTIDGPTQVMAGNAYTYTIYGVPSINLHDFNLPANASCTVTGNNTVRIAFQAGWMGNYVIGYQDAYLNVQVAA